MIRKEEILNLASDMQNNSALPLHGFVESDEFYNQFQSRLNDPNLKDKMGHTLLHVAAWSKRVNSKIVQLLLDRGADVDAPTPHGHTALQFAVWSQKLSTVIALIEAGASVNYKDFFGRTALHFSVSAKWCNHPSSVVNFVSNIEIVKFLSSHPKTLLNLVDDVGETPLMWAAKDQNWEAVKVLLKNGANPNIPCNNNRTPLHEVLSFRNRRYEVVYNLLENGAGIYCADNLGQTPVDILFRKDRGDRMLGYELHCVWLIAVHYNIKDDLKIKLKPSSISSYFLPNCCKEVRLMSRLIIYDKVTLHDFALDCFQTRVEEPVREIYTPVVEILLSGEIMIYFELVFSRLSVPDLLDVLKITADNRPYLNSIHPEVTSLIVYDIIKRFYEENDELKKRLQRWKSSVAKWF